MQPYGIYTLANDVVYDQFVALLNSIEANVSPDLPICVIPFDEKLEKIKQEIDSRANVTLFNNYDAIQRWEDFAQQVWAAHPQGSQNKSAQLVKSRMRMQRRYAAFDGNFEKFVIYDADCLAMKPLDSLFAKLENYNFVFDDWEHAKPEPVTALNLSLIEKSGNFSAKNVRSKLHCASFFGSHRGLFTPQKIAQIQDKLIAQREVEWINGVSEAFLFNYMTLRGEYTLFNFTLSPNGQERTGNCADADLFVNIDRVLYNQDGLKPIHRIHYMNYAASDFSRLCQGEDTNICYKDEFLYYRFLKHPEQMPKQLQPPSVWKKTNRLFKKAMKKLEKVI
ncbi:MAG TPA: Npun_R2821/Npun_R2822 family protein [Oculatellaceae cyanobacterium]|jgi:hypothetical protein